jgi:hypothetical protein
VPAGIRATAKKNSCQLASSYRPQIERGSTRSGVFESIPGRFSSGSGQMPAVFKIYDLKYENAAKQWPQGYLNSKGASTTELVRLTGTEFRTLAGSTADGSTQKGRLTNLTKLTVDTSYWGRYRSDSNNPDLDPKFQFTQAVPSLNSGQHPAIPRNNDDTLGSKIVFNPDGSVDFTNSVIPDHLKAIAFTAGFHFGFIEQGGTSLYPSLAQRVTDPEVLRILLSIGPTETMHFQTWHDKAGNATPLNVDGLTFIDLHASTDETLQANLIMPEPCPFLKRKFPICSIIRPTATKGAAMGAVTALTADGLFIGHEHDALGELLKDLASDADAARREREFEAEI